MIPIEHKVEEQNNGWRLDTLIANTCPELSRSAAARLIDGGDVLLDGRVVKKNAVVSTGNIIEISMPPLQEATAVPQNIPLDIVYEDDDIVVVNKPKGMVVHPGAGNPDKTLVNALLFHCGDSLSGIGGVTRPGIVHRIDKDTSGLLVVAKNDTAHAGLASLLANHDIKRCYHAVVKGRIKNESASINAPIARDKTNRLRMAVDPNGRAAITHYRVIQQYKEYTHVELILETGRTHQIRVHMRSIGHPLAGDEVYGEHSNPKLLGQCLHAKQLEFVHPTSGETMNFSTQLPDYFTQFLQRLRPFE